MKIFKVFAIVCLFFFLIACEETPKRLVPIDESGDNSDTTDPTNPDDPTNPTDPTNPDPTDPTNPDPTNPTDDPTNPTDDPTNPTDPTNPDPTDPTNPDPTDPTNPTDDPTNPTDPTDDPTDPTDDPTDPTDDPTDPTNPTDPTTDPDYCSAVFNGNTSKIEVAHNDNLNLSSDAWTIEAWIKQTGNLTSTAAAIVGKKNGSNSFTYSLSDYFTTTTGSTWQQQTTTAMKGSAYYKIFTTSEISAEATKLTNSGNWTHIALVQSMSSTFGMKKPTLTLYINGTKAAEGESNVTSNQAPSIVTSTEALLIGSGFNGLIDSVRISSSAKYTAKFTPAALSAEGDTIAFWDFSGNANESKSGMTSNPTDVTYSTDCK